MAAQRSEHLLTAGSGGKSGRQRRGNPGATWAESETRHPAQPGDLEAEHFCEKDLPVLKRPPCRVARRRPDQ